jgi:preprotein translocase subunit SecG
MEWIKTTLILLLGWLVMITGMIEYLFIGCMVWLVLCLVVEVINNYTKQQIIKNQADFWDKSK